MPRHQEKLGLKLECEFESEGVRLLRYAIERATFWLLAAKPRVARTLL